MKLLDPKNDLTFKKVFGEHPNLCISLLNSILPLPEGDLIENIEYLPSEMVPTIPLGKNSIVDVRCRDNHGRQFIVEMQLIWTDSFKYRVLFNASKAFVCQLEKSSKFELLQPVYSLNFVNERFLKDENRFYHHYQIVNIEQTNEQIKGLEFVFIELPKFKPQNVTQKKMMALWLRYLTEISDGTRNVSIDLTSNAEIREALEIIEESAYSFGELSWYDSYWDIVRTERSYLSDAENKGKMEGLLEGKMEGLLEGKMEEQRLIAQKLLKRNFSVSEIEELTGLNVEEIKKIQLGL